MRCFWPSQWAFFIRHTAAAVAVTIAVAVNAEQSQITQANDLRLVRRKRNNLRWNDSKQTNGQCLGVCWTNGKRLGEAIRQKQLDLPRFKIIIFVLCFSSSANNLQDLSYHYLILNNSGHHVKILFNIIEMLYHIRHPPFSWNAKEAIMRIFDIFSAFNQKSYQKRLGAFLLCTKKTSLSTEWYRDGPGYVSILMRTKFKRWLKKNPADPQEEIGLEYHNPPSYCRSSSLRNR